MDKEISFIEENLSTNICFGIVDFKNCLHFRWKKKKKVSFSWTLFVTLSGKESSLEGKHLSPPSFEITSKFKWIFLSFNG